MGRFISLTIALVLSISAWGQSYLDRCDRLSMKFQGRERICYIFQPEGVGEGSPMVMCLHGYGGNARESTPAELFACAERHGFALCIPDGLKDGTGHTCWNVGYPFQSGWKVDDVKFVCALARKLQKERGYSQGATFLTGMSNGGEMCYLTAMRKSEAFTAIASIAGLTMKWMADEYSLTGPVPFMEVHGTQDHTSEWLGDAADEGGWGAYIPVPIAVSRVVVADRCTAETVSELPRREGRNPVTVHRFTDGRKTAWGTPMEVWLYEVHGGDHSWSLSDMDTCEEMWKFFSKWIH